MARVKLSKSSLSQQRNKLALCKRLLPSLDLKRRQLTVELGKARRQHEAARAEVEALDAKIGAELPMLAGADPELFGGVVTVADWDLRHEHVVGVELPVLAGLRCDVSEYSFLALPPWVDVLVQRLSDAAEARLRVQVGAERVRILEIAVRRMTQRVNLFQKILIPTIQTSIQRIRIFLGDMERDAVVRAKLAKARRIEDRQVGQLGGAGA